MSVSVLWVCVCVVSGYGWVVSESGCVCMLKLAKMNWCASLGGCECVSVRTSYCECKHERVGTSGDNRNHNFFILGYAEAQGPYTGQNSARTSLDYKTIPTQVHL